MAVEYSRLAVVLYFSLLAYWEVFCFLLCFWFLLYDRLVFLLDKNYSLYIYIYIKFPLETHSDGMMEINHF